MTYLFDGINHPTVAQVQAAGAVGCLMYGGTPGDGLGKDFTAAQYASYKAAGLLCAFVYENTANDMAGGFTAGSAHADALVADLRAKGVASTEPVGATVDEHVSAANIPLAVEYQMGFHDTVKARGWMGPVGGYGFAEFLIAIHDALVCDWFWGAGPRSSLPPYTNIWQDNTGTILVGGATDDRDWILVPLPAGGHMTMAWSDQFPVPNLDSAGKYTGDRTNPNGTVQTASVEDNVRFGNAATWWILDAVKALGAQITALGATTQAEITAEQTALLAAIKTLPAPVVQQITADPTAVAQQLITAGLPGDLVGALLAVLQKAAPPAAA